MGEEIFIDANIFLEIFLKDKKAEECKSFLRSLQEQERNGVTTDFIIYSCILQVQNKLKNAEFIANTIIFFNRYISTPRSKKLLGLAILGTFIDLWILYICT